MSASATQGGHNNVSTVTTLGTTIFITINQSIVPQTVTCIKFAFEFSLSNFYHFARYLIIYAQTSVHQTELSEIVLPKQSLNNCADRINMLIKVDFETDVIVLRRHRTQSACNHNHNFREIQKPCVLDLDLGSGQGHINIHNTHRTTSMANHMTVASRTAEMSPLEFREISTFWEV